MVSYTKPLSQTTKNYSKEDKELKEKAEKKLNELTPLESEPPEWLSDLAKDEYNRIYPLLMELPISSLDFTLISTYCQAYADYVDANENLRNESVIVYTDSGSKLNPYHTVKRDSFKIINSVVSKLGMTIDSRMKIFTPKANEKKPDDPMGDFLDGTG
ncbi:phage terminase small subunit P27 family [Staphylococcus pseudoxylosus]|uniref:phage terminase small subunit P27 family n=1 Tax=Staphylococcus pseudoxylosus TaxID=2282419 RepID=UPI002DB7DDF2|nr:phage terminase small subunit P27 family [Staphylococcus pseudoxylosus]MEB8088248.1 phage terminase small subunit P27 family [Staphylococcus pseudoxylosus]